MSSSSRSIRDGVLAMLKSVGPPSDDMRRRCASSVHGHGPSPLRPARIARRASTPRRRRVRRSCAASAATTPCEIDFVARLLWTTRGPSGWARRPAQHDVALSVHAPLARLHGPSGGAAGSSRWRSACSTAAPGSRPRCGAEVVVFHPGFLLGRERRRRSTPSSSSSRGSRERLEGKGRRCRSGSR